MIPLDDEEQRKKLEAAQEAFRYQIVLYTQRWLSGEIHAQEWRVLFELEVRYLQTIAALIAVGSPQALTPELQRLVREETENQLRYLRRWVSSTALPTPRASAAVILNRARLYASAGWRTYALVRTRALGLPDLPFYPGERSSCMGACKCFWWLERGEGEGDWDAYWRQTAVESCPECDVRAQVCRPLRIRGGVVQPFSQTGTVL